MVMLDCSNWSHVVSELLLLPCMICLAICHFLLQLLNVRVNGRIETRRVFVFQQGFLIDRCHRFVIIFARLRLNMLMRILIMILMWHWFDSLAIFEHAKVVMVLFVRFVGLMKQILRGKAISRRMGMGIVCILSLIFKLIFAIPIV